MSLQLEKAKELITPTREEVLRRDPSAQQFWLQNKDLLIEAWQEWDKENKLAFPNDSIIDPKLKSSIEMAWANPEKEIVVKDLLQQVSTGVYQFQFFNPDKIIELKTYLDKANDSQVPLRPPYGIVLNRKGAMLDRRSEGFLAAPSFQTLYQEIMNKYMRPISRLLFPEVLGYDTQTFGFSIQYQPQKDTSIRMHTDASSVTLNINLNSSENEFSGSEVDFHNPKTRQYDRIKFKPGVAVIHRGNVAHAAQPITDGERTNLVLWLYGDKMQIPRHFSSTTSASPQERWTNPTGEPDHYAPF